MSVFFTSMGRYNSITQPKVQHHDEGSGSAQIMKTLNPLLSTHNKNYESFR